MIDCELASANRNAISRELIFTIKENFLAANANSLQCEVFDNLVTACQIFIDSVLQCEMKDELLSLLELSGPIIISLDDKYQYSYESKRDGLGRIRSLFQTLKLAQSEDNRRVFERFGYVLRNITEISDSDLICSELAKNTFEIPDCSCEQLVRAYCPQDNLGTSFESDGEIFVPYEIRMSHSLEHVLAEVKYLYNSFSGKGKNITGVPIQLIKEYHGLGFALNHNPRAVGLWLWDYIQKRYGQHEDLPHGAKAEARKAFKSRFDAGKLGYSDSDPRVFDRLYTRTNECIQKPEVLSMR